MNVRSQILSFVRQKYFWLLFCLPFIVWFCAFSRTLQGGCPLTWHGVDYYYITKYYMENILRGVYPQWDPFGSWGRPDDIDARFVGEFSPFLWLYPFLASLNIARPIAYLLYSYIYFQIGSIGFYLLAKRLFQDRLTALAAATLLMFSSVFFSVFSNFGVYLLMLPVIWFFYHLLSFSQDARRHHFLGMVFFLELICLTYMPFYFLTLMQPFLVAMLVLYFKEAREFLGALLRFLRTYPVFATVALVSLGLTLIPGIQWFWESAKGDMLLSWRHSNANDLHTASMSLNTIQSSHISHFLDWRGLFCDLKEYRHMVFFVSVFFYVLLLIGLVNRINRRQITLAFIASWLFLMSLGELTPVHRFLYEHIYFYRLFRNLNYFIDFLVPVAILLGVEQLWGFMRIMPRPVWQKVTRVTFVVIVHILFAVFLYTLGGIMPSSYVTVFVSAVFFLLAEFLRGIARTVILGVLLVAVCSVQPIDFLSGLIKSETAETCSPVDAFVPVFSYVRPAQDEKYHKDKSPAKIQDDSGFLAWKYTGLRWSYNLQNNIPRDILEPYTRNKFAVYDRVRFVAPDQMDYGQLAAAFKDQANLAFVFAPPGQKPFSFADPGQDQALWISQGSDQLRVTKFDLNTVSLETNFTVPKFLVYNDSFQDHWQAYVNNERVTLFQANAAFKGVWLPPGKNQVRFQYRQARDYIFRFFMVFLLTVQLALLLWLSWQARLKKKD